VSESIDEKKRIRLYPDNLVVKILAIDKDEKHDIQQQISTLGPDIDIGESADTQCWTGSCFKSFYTVTVDVPDRDTARTVAEFVAERFGETVNVEEGRQ